jgi:hypothetical protein
MAIIRANNNTLSSVTSLPFATGGLVKLLNTTASSGASEYIVDSTYINSTYDNYRIIAGYQYVTDNVGLNIRFYVGGSEVSANYAYEMAALTSSTYPYDVLGATTMQVGAASGNATGETGTLVFDLTNANSTTITTRMHGFQYSVNQNGNTVGYVFQAGQDPNAYSSVVNGLKFYMGSGNIIMRHFTIYGLTK